MKNFGWKKLGILAAFSGLTLVANTKNKVGDCLSLKYEQGSVSGQVDEVINNVLDLRNFKEGFKH